MGDLIEETDSILVQSHYMFKSHRVLSFADTSDLLSRKTFINFRSNVLCHETMEIIESSDNFLLTAKKLEPNRGQTDNVSKTFCFACVVDSFETPSSQLDCTMFTHCGGLMSRADKAGFGNKNRVSLIVGLWSISAARWSRAAIFK